MSSRRVPVRLAEDEHRLVAAEARQAGQSLNRFIVTAAVGRALHARGQRGEPSPFDTPRCASRTDDPPPHAPTGDVR